MNSSYIVGLDLGQAQDYTALTILERFHEDRPVSYHLRHLERFQLGMPYPEQVARVKAMLEREPLEQNSTLVVDGTGAGRPVVDMFRDAHINVRIVAITITGGDGVNADEYKNNLRVPKRDMIAALQVLLQSGRLKVAKQLKDVDTLIQELLNFKVKISSGGHDSYEAWREGVHDDLVLSAAMAGWYGEWQPYQTFEFAVAVERERREDFTLGPRGDKLGFDLY